MFFFRIVVIIMNQNVVPNSFAKGTGYTTTDPES